MKCLDRSEWLKRCNPVVVSADNGVTSHTAASSLQKCLSVEQMYNVEITELIVLPFGDWHWVLFGSEWFNGLWLEVQITLSIAYKELFPIVIAAKIWEIRWYKQHILFCSDNEAVVAILNSRTFKVPCIMNSLTHSQFYLLQLNIPKYSWC